MMLDNNYKKEIAYYEQSPFYKYAKYKVFIQSNFCKSRVI